MRKRQYGKGRLIYQSDHNTAENYTELNIREVAVDGGILGVITGGVLIPHGTLEHTVIIQSTIARSGNGDRIVIASSSNLFIKPSVDPGIGNEVYMTAYAQYDYQMGEQDVDSDDVVYYKDYLNSYSLSAVQGTISPTGTATKPSVPTNAILLCDILYSTTLYASGDIEASDINTDRQNRFDNQSFINLSVTGIAEFDGLATFNAGIDMEGTNITDISDPASGDEIGDRDYNDARYVNTTGDTMTGLLTVPNLNVTTNMTLQNLTVTGSLLANNGGVFGGDVNVTGDFAVNAGDAAIGSGSLDVSDLLTARGLKFPWQQSTTYVLGEVVYYDDIIYKCIIAHTSSTNFYIDSVTKWEAISGGSGTTSRVTLASHGFQVGDVLRYDSNADPNGYLRAKADSSMTLGQFVVVQVLDSNNFIISSGGYFKDETYTISISADTWYYLSDTTAGLLTSVEPQISNTILYGISANEAFVFMYRPGVGATMHVDEFTATEGQTQFVLEFAPIRKDYVDVFVQGVSQGENNYTITGRTLTFTSGLTDGQLVRIKSIHNMLAHPGASIDHDEFTVTSTGETTFTLTYDPVSEDYAIVTVNGVVQHSGDYDIVEYTLTFTTSTGLTAGDEVRVLHIRNLNFYEFPASASIGSLVPLSGYTDIDIITSTGYTNFIGGINVYGSIYSSTGIVTDGYIDISSPTSTGIICDGYIEVGTTDAFYFGDPVTDGTWRIIRDGDNLVFQRRETGSYISKDTITP